MPVIVCALSRTHTHTPITLFGSALSLFHTVLSTLFHAGLSLCIARTHIRTNTHTCTHAHTHTHTHKHTTCAHLSLCSHWPVTLCQTILSFCLTHACQSVSHRPVTLSVGRLAHLADGSVLIESGQTAVLVTGVSHQLLSSSPSSGVPLKVSDQRLVHLQH